MELKNETTHVVIEFVGSNPPGQRKEVDLVPASWLTNANGKWKCKYPPEKDYSKRTGWTKKSRLPNPEWLAWKVKVIKEAKNYDEGIRRLERSYSTSNVDSTSAAEDSHHEPSNTDQEYSRILDKNELNLALKQAPAIRETITEHETESTGVTNKSNSALHESSITTGDSSEVDENDRTLIHYTQSPQSSKGRSKSYSRNCVSNIRESDTSSDGQNLSPPLRTSTSLKRSVVNARASRNEQGPSLLPRVRKNPKPPVTFTDTSSDEQRPSPPPKKKRTSIQPPVVVVPLVNNVQRQHDNVMSAVTQEGLDNMEKRILKKIESAKRSVLYDINVKVEQLKNTMVLNSETSGMNIAENRKCLNIELPVRDPVAFAAFDEALQTAPDKEKALKCIMTAAISGVESGNKAVTNILKSVLAKPVQEVYSGCGRGTKGISKKNFSSTKTYSRMQDVVGDNHNITKDTILSVTSRWLSGSVDRDRGRVRPAARVIPAIAPVVCPVPAAPAIVDHEADLAATVHLQQPKS